jgi:hypothetical protein
MSETEAQREQREAAFQQRMRRDGQLGLMLSQHLWDKHDPFRLGDEEFKVISCDDVPGHEDEEYGVFLRRTSDGQVFDAEIDVSINPVREPAQVTP